MNGAWHGKPCPVCGEGTLHDGLRKEFIEYRGHKFGVEQPGAYCDHCDDGIVYHDPASEEALQKFRAGVDELERQELSAVRQYLGLTQQQAASIAGGGHNAFSRYERGEAHPVLGVVNLFRILGRHPELLQELGIARQQTWRTHDAIYPYNPSAALNHVDTWSAALSNVSLVDFGLGKVNFSTFCDYSRLPQRDVANEGTDVEIVGDLLGNFLMWNGRHKRGTAHGAT